MSVSATGQASDRNRPSTRTSFPSCINTARVAIGRRSGALPCDLRTNPPVGAGDCQAVEIKRLLPRFADPAVRMLFKRSIVHRKNRSLPITGLVGSWRTPGKYRTPRLRRGNGLRSGEYCTAGSRSCECRRPVPTSGDWRHGIYLRNRAHTLQRRQMGADGRGSSFQPRNMCITRSSTFDRRIPTGCAMPRLEYPSRPRRLAIRRTVATRMEPPATCCWCTRPAARRISWPDGMAKFVPAGSDVVFQMHYTTQWPCRTRPDQHRPGVCQDAAGATRYHPAARTITLLSFRRGG